MIFFYNKKVFHTDSILIDKVMILLIIKKVHIIFYK